MAKNLTNKQLQIVVDEIYDKISRPIVEENNRLLDEVEVINEEHPYLVDCILHEKLKNQIEVLKDRQIEIQEKYYNKEVNGVVLSTWKSSTMQNADSYINNIKENAVELHPVISKREIEKQVILAGNSDIPALIEQLILKLSI